MVVLVIVAGIALAVWRGAQSYVDQKERQFHYLESSTEYERLNDEEMRIISQQ